MRRTLLRVLASVALLSVLVPACAQADNRQGPIVRFATSLGNIDVQLLPGYAPKTVANFLSYVNSGAYATTFFHRSAQQFGVIQGGSYDIAGGQRQTITTTAPIPLEYDLPNARGTLAMARTSNPNSATSGWFLNNTDNSAEWAPSSGNAGYAAFGQILSPGGYQVMDAIAAQRVVDDSFGSSSTLYSELPVINYSGASPVTLNSSLTNDNLIMSPVTVVNDMTAPTITITQPTNRELFTQGQTLTPQFTCTDGTNNDGSAGTGVAGCTSSPVDLSTPGQKTFTVSTTDYAGNATSQSVTYTVNPAPPAPKPIVTPPSPKPHAIAEVVPALHGSLIVAKSGKLPLTLRCTTAARCTGSLALTMAAARHRTVRVVSGRYAITARRSAKLTFRLGPATVKLLRAHKHLVLTLTFVPAGGRTHTQRVTVRLGAH